MCQETHIITTFCQVLNKSTSPITIIHQNIQGLRSKIDIIEHFLD